MFMCNKVEHMLTKNDPTSVDIRSIVGASYRRDRYNVSINMDMEGNVIKGTCTCKAGALGRCKHVAATLYQLNDYRERNISSIPADIACTEQPRKWGVKKGKAPVISKSFGELIFVKYTPGKTPRSIENSKRRQEYSSLPPAKMNLSKERIENLVHNLKPYRTMWSQILMEVILLCN